ncbi:MAG: hypothetical protein Kow0063_37940 [Anaerolineae bacterium]
MDKTVAHAKDISKLRPMELHYFRVPRQHWVLMLARIRQLGADAVSTIVPWLWHEPQEGFFDLSGLTHPARDVSSFLETCQAMGFPVALRVSPYLGAGLLGGGVPGWLLKKHPEICALGPDSQPRRDPATRSAFPSPGHPVYLKYLERWYRELSGALVSWSWPDGPVVALELDQSGPPGTDSSSGDIPAGWDYNPHVVEVQWPIWLRQQYDGIEALNAAWGTGYRSFSDAEFPRRFEALGSTQRQDDATRFVAHASDQAREACVRLLREAGWTIPITADLGALPAPHVAQVDPEPPQVGAGVRWAMDAPVQANGWPRRQFWAVKAATLDMEEGVKPVAGACLVTASESRRFRLPRPAGDYAVYRLLLDGGLLEASSRTRGDTLYLNYVAADEAGTTDMYIILDAPSTPLSGFLREYLTSLLMGKVSSIQQAGAMCQVMAEALSGVTPPASKEETPASPPGSEDLAAAEQSLAEAHRAARRAAASIGRLERLAGAVRGDVLHPAPAPSDASAFSAGELERLSPVRQACARVGPALIEVAGAIQTACQPGASETQALTIQTYQVILEEARAATGEAETTLTDALARLRTDLVSGVLPAAAWTLQDWLTRTLQSLAAAT